MGKEVIKPEKIRRFGLIPHLWQERQPNQLSSKNSNPSPPGKKDRGRNKFPGIAKKIRGMARDFGSSSRRESLKAPPPNCIRPFAQRGGRANRLRQPRRVKNDEQDGEFISPSILIFRTQ